MKKMLAILATPRKKGKVAAMLSAAVEQGKKCGYEVTIVDLYQKNIKYCTGCMACRKTGTCIIKDDAWKISQLLSESDYIVLAAPSYFANVPAPMKAFFDRIAGVMMSESKSGIPHGRMQKKQKYLLLTACNTPFPFDRICGQSTGCIRAMKEVMKVSGMTMAGKVILAGAKQKKEVPLKLIRNIQRLVK